MLANLFKPAWKSQSVEKRLKAIAEMANENEEQQKILAQLANDDSEISVCIAAIQKLNDASLLHKISLVHGTSKNNKDVCNTASDRLNDLLSESAAFNTQQFDDLLKTNPELCVRVAAYAGLFEVRTKAIQTLSDEQLLEVLSLSTFTDSRQQIADKLCDVNLLESARKILRGKDKTAERIVKAKLDEFKKQQRQQSENHETVLKLIEEVEYLSTRDDWLPDFMERCKDHCSRWDKLDFEIDINLKQRYQASRDTLDTLYQDRILIKETHQSQQTLVDELQRFLQSITKKDLAEAIDQLNKINENYDQISSQWQSLSSISEPVRHVNDQYEEKIAALIRTNQLITEIAPIFSTDNSSVIDSSEESGDAQKHSEQNVKNINIALKKLKWPASLGALQLETELREQLLESRQLQKNETKNQEQQLSVAHKNISSIFHFARTGNLTRAKQMCIRAEKALDKFNGKDRSALQSRYDVAFQSLGDMGDWKSFATEPKYLELCESMEQLVGSKTHPDKMFQDMKALQQQWKELDNSDIADLHWPRFKESADAVYAPCAVFFEERKDLRKTNLAKRQTYVEEMQELLKQIEEDNRPDYKSMESSLRSINSRFIAIKDVEHKAGQKQWTQFSNIKTKVFDKLGLEYDANIELKQTLIKQAETLAQAPVNDENLNILKTLQFRWKQVGVTRRKDDQKAWIEFKKHGDHVYNQMQAVRQGLRDENDQQLNAYRNIIKEIKNLAKTATELSQADHQFSAFQVNYEELPELSKELPEKLIEGIQRDYQNACSQFDDCHDRIINNYRKQQLQALRLRADLCTELEALFDAAKGKSPKAEKLEDLNKQWNAISLEDAEFLKRIESRRESAQKGIERDEITAERRLMCIQLEITKGTETPEEDKAQRMQFQLDQMNQSGLGQQTLNNKEQLESMELDWLCLPGAEPQQQAILDKRFWQAFNAK